MHHLTSGEVKLGEGDTLCKHFLLPHLKTYHESFPNIKIQVFNRTTTETITLLKEGKIDIGIVNLPISDLQIDIQESITIQDRFIVGEKYKYLSEEVVSFEKLLDFPIILLEKDGQTRTCIDEFASENGFIIKPEIELGSLDLLVEFTRNGFGIACVISEFIKAELSLGNLFEIQLEKPIPSRKVGIIKRKSTPLSVAANHLHNMLVATN
ncbi:LysR family transcriptional regulator substrate-binding protein [Paenibacillus sp. GSMTC-2017]|uniref:LysR family transcriptional regulator substrate-binding protein n=1 Tax=Paenibacillus sp. GSMTC-2017 TaxID=2794350 RepID=UPI0018D7931E|nr:LysR family transcriptional regulator substrate-binding protein [Paenibacillus sp. GSMTC-2017]MBH5316233.1 LysR family transcriptional regulator substrate-binding protein [Paenibacillus sp. GSMTC-2017]